VDRLGLQMVRDLVDEVLGIQRRHAP
jgi:hypothetical protein